MDISGIASPVVFPKSVAAMFRLCFSRPMPWTDIYHWTTPRSEWIIGRKVDGREIEVRFDPLKQRWVDRQGEPVNVEQWREIDDV